MVKRTFVVEVEYKEIVNEDIYVESVDVAINDMLFDSYKRKAIEKDYKVLVEEIEPIK